MSLNQTSSGPRSKPRGARPLALTFAIALGLLFTANAAPASAQELSIHIEPAAAFWLNEPQTDRFTTGLYAAVRPNLSLGRVTALQLSYAYLYAPASEDFVDDGSAHAITGGLRIRPFAMLLPDVQQLGGLWVDGNAGYARTGSLGRFAFDTGLGYGFQVAPTFALGPVVRYVQIVEPNNRDDFDTSDARLLTVGVNFTFGPVWSAPVEEEQVVERIERAPAPECIQAECIQEECVQQPCPELAENTCIDTDGDGVCDHIDRCPLEPGPARTFGCPTNPCDGRPLRVLVQFDFDSSRMPVIRTGDEQTMDPVLDAVAEAIAQDPTCRVGILGHASEEGDSDHNQRLSEARAAAVQRYMIERGVDARSIPYRGMGERCQLRPESTRVLNRRVDFFRLEEGADMPTECLP